MDNITAKDLMIGDWVLYNPNVFIEDEYELPKDPYPTKISCGEDIDLAFEDCYSPIPITAQILEKNGFVKSYGVSDTPPYDKDEEGNMYYSFKGEHKFWGWWQPDNTYYVPANAMGDIVIKYLHELQHALRLAGIKKTIEL